MKAHCSRRNEVLQILLAIFGLLAATGCVMGQSCAEPQTSGRHSFRQQGERFEIPITIANCAPATLELRWSNGRNNGSNLHVTFFDRDNQAIYTRELSGFLSGSFVFPLTTLEQQPWFGQGSIISVPVKVTIEAVRPFALPATISYKVTRTPAHTEANNFETTAEQLSVNKANCAMPTNGKVPN